MKKEKVLGIYDKNYVDKYNDNFLLEPFSKAGVDFELELLRRLILPGTKWLDIGCGTGYFLSQFPGTSRGGYDLSPVMLAEARRVNTDAIFREGDFRNNVAEWEGQWSLVSCMWSAYAYVETVAEVEKVVANMIGWLREGGDIFIPVVDLEDLRTDVIVVPYAERNPVYGGTIYVTSCTWTWVEDDQAKVHETMIAPHVEHFVRLLEPYFETVEIIRYPAFQDGWCTKKVLLAKNKAGKHTPAGHKAQVIRHPVPANGYQVPLRQHTANNAVAAVHPTAAELGTKQLFRELLSRIKNGRIAHAVFNKISSTLRRQTTANQPA